MDLYRCAQLVSFGRAGPSLHLLACHTNVALLDLVPRDVIEYLVDLLKKDLLADLALHALRQLSAFLASCGPAVLATPNVLHDHICYSVQDLRLSEALSLAHDGLHRPPHIFPGERLILLFYLRLGLAAVCDDL